MGLVAGVISAALLSSIGVSDVICNLVIMIVCAIVTYFVFTWWNYTEITGRQD
jgi:uncharacterized membrane protein YeaQ/YmgE (transglycosylase-associated protein family)